MPPTRLGPTGTNDFKKVRARMQTCGAHNQRLTVNLQALSSSGSSGPPPNPVVSSVRSLGGWWHWGLKIPRQDPGMPSIKEVLDKQPVFPR